VLNTLKYGNQDTAVRVAVTGDQDKVRFDVTNIGPAFEQSTLDRIFDPLKRGVVEDHTRRSGSLGLGLYIARQIAKSHGGDIQVISDTGETVFSVLLPRHHTLRSANR
jgi:signal transduction histidine kinase